MMTGVVSLVARSESTSGSITFAGVDAAAYPHLAPHSANPRQGRPPRRIPSNGRCGSC